MIFCIADGTLQKGSAGELLQSILRQGEVQTKRKREEKRLENCRLMLHWHAQLTCGRGVQCFFASSFNACGASVAGPPCLQISNDLCHFLYSFVDFPPSFFLLELVAAQ